MTRVYILCEGQTEEAFVKALLDPHFQSKNIYLKAILLGKPGHKGGNVNFDRLFPDIRNLLRGDKHAYCTTFFDFYGLPADFPGKNLADSKRTAQDKADAIHQHLIEKLNQKLNQEQTLQRFIPYVQMYEFEALLFSDPDKFATVLDQPKLRSNLQKIKNAFDTPEEINDSPNTAPSKRITQLIKGYDKPIYGSRISSEIGLKTIREECKLFDAWLQKLEMVSPMNDR